MYNNLCAFQHHPKFLAELEAFISKHCSVGSSVDKTIEYIQKLLELHFYGNTGPKFSGKDLGPAQGFGGYSVFFLRIVIPDGRLSKTQNPKSYFLKRNDSISFLCLDSHITNYKDNELKKTAIKRLKEILIVL